jgi:phospholipase C
VELSEEGFNMGKCRVSWVLYPERLQEAGVSADMVQICPQRVLRQPMLEA